MEQEKHQFNTAGWSMEEIRQVVGGSWYHPLKKEVYAKRFAMGKSSIPKEKDAMFIAMDTPTFLNGSKNTSIYGKWEDTHPMIDSIKNRVVAYIVQHPSATLPDEIPQLVVKDSYNCIVKLGDAARAEYQGKIIAVTGTVGKTSTKEILVHLLSKNHSVHNTIGSHNSRTAAMLTLAGLKSQPEFCVLEVAMGALWTSNGGICTHVHPHIAIITQVGLSQADQAQSVQDTAKFKSRICNGINPGGFAVINAEIADLDIVVQGVKQYGATPILYGKDTDSKLISYKVTTKGTIVRANILGEQVEYTLGSLGKGLVMNSIAAMTALKLLGIDIQSLAKHLSSYVPHKSVMELINVDIGAGTVTLVDDSFNAETLSMFTAFETMHDLKQKGGRQVAVLGQLIKLGEKSLEMHKSLAPAIVANKFDKVFAQGDDMNYMLEDIPERMNGGLYYSAHMLAKAAAEYIEVGDIVLIKGDPRDTDFKNIRSLLVEAIHNKYSGVPNYKFCCASLRDTETQSVIRMLGQKEAQVYDEGLGGVLTVYFTLELLANHEITLEDQVVIQHVTSDTKNSKALGLVEGETVSVELLLKAIIAGLAPAAVIILANHMCKNYGQKVVDVWGAIARRLKLSENVVANVTGRPTKAGRQFYTIDDLQKLADAFFALPVNALDILKTKEIKHKKRIITNDSQIYATNEALYSFCFGYNSYNAITLGKRPDGRLVTACICNANHPLERDFRVAELLYDNAMTTALKPRKAGEINPRTNIITIAGDTYFGESYTAQRVKLGQKDALSTIGYSHCFEKVDAFLRESDFNILNFEAVLTERTTTPMQGKFSFILRGDPDNTIKEFTRRRVHAVTLANNHSMDFGVPGLYDSFKAFNDAGIYTIGCGRTAHEAFQGLEVNLNNRRIIFLSAYWHRGPRHKNGYYAMGSHAGSAVIWDPLFATIERYRSEAPDSTIIPIVHWGTDYSIMVEDQRTLADQMIRSGADLIIGHGPHTIAPIEFMNGKPVLYSIGNFVFNNNGDDFKKKNVLSYGLVPRLGVFKDRLELKVYPLFCFNPETFWQPYPVTDKQFGLVANFLGTVGGRLVQGKDHLGHYLAVQM